MYEQIYSLTCMFFKSLKGNLMYEFLKNYHKIIKELMQDKVPNLPNYENFMKATNKSTVFILAFMNFLMKLNRLKGRKQSVEWQFIKLFSTTKHLLLVVLNTIISL